jgi:hypothetical protein
MHPIAIFKQNGSFVLLRGFGAAALVRLGLRVLGLGVFSASGVSASAF